MSVSLPGELQQRCIEILNACDEFENQQMVRAMFSASELVHLRDGLPEAGNRRERVALIVTYLIERKSGEQWALVIFITALRKQYDHQDDRARRLDALVPQILTALETSGKRQRVLSSEEQGYRKTAEAAAEAFTQDDETDKKATSAIEAWFDRAGDDSALWALRLALAVFNNGPRTAFIEARQRLVALLQPEQPPASTTPDAEHAPAPAKSPSLFDSGQRLSRLLEQADAELDEAPLDPQHPHLGTVEIVRLRDPKLAYAALPYVWREYDQVRPALIQWLTELVANRSSADTRSRAAVAVGVLAASDFVPVRDQIIRRWGGLDHDKPLYRTAIGRALGVAAQADWRRQEVVKLLAFWAQHTNRATRWVAARAYIYVGGVIEAEEVLRQWRRIYVAEPETLEVLEQWRILCDTPLPKADLTRPPGHESLGQITPHWLAGHYFYLQQNDLRRNPLLASLIDGIFTFFVYGATLPVAEARPLFTGIMRGLMEWDTADCEQSKIRDRRRLASFPLLLFFLLLRLLHRAEDAEEPPLPLVLVLIEPAPGAPFRQGLAELLLLCYHYRQPTRQPLLNELKDMLSYIDGLAVEAQMHTMFSDLVAIAPPGSRICESLLYELNRWARQAGSEDSPYRRAVKGLEPYCRAG